MSKNAKSGFVIKLSTETVQKLTEEEELAKKQAEDQHLQEVQATGSNLEEKDLKDNDDKVSRSSEELSTTNNRDVSPSPGAKNSESASKVVLMGKEDTEPSVHKDNIEHKEGSKTDSSDNSTWGDYAPYITYEGEEAIYTDPTTQVNYTWDLKTNSWTPKPGSEVPGRIYSYENDTHIYTDADGSKSFWDEEKKAWLPKVDDDFLAHYQMSYGFIDNTSKEDEESKKKEKEKEKLPKEQTSGVKRKNDPQWFDATDETNTKVYVSNLPLDLTEEEFVNFMQKCGLVERDPQSQKMKVKLYMDKEQNCFKGDALCTYIKIESVDLALKLLDGSDFKGNTVKVERAHFQLKGEYNPALKPKKKKKKELEKLKKMQQKLFDWRPEKFVGERSKHERIVIIKNLFHPSDFDKDVQLILDYQQDLREEATKCGEVRKVVIYDRHPEGVAQITMKEPEQADAVVALVNGRWFGKRQITAEIWDGRTKYRIAETDADLSKRVDKWDKFLEGKEEPETSKLSVKTDNETGVTSEQPEKAAVELPKPPEA
ncbi:HIV Tat-specific factor 1 homolog [Leguminivora glycinivorella]|uniref:HIV Tat-specific factor 1 homolog n=1 Tax=Leguminivora glycinivorella TaxID=1035111 RepID=UPI0020105C1B|nr:HIV Tat-specific factor 1 homolog [Leguminivora glycinivorella]